MSSPQRDLHLFFSVGEPSGDLHGANLIRELKLRQPGIRCVGLGGPKMREAGLDQHHDLTSLAVMWFVQAIVHLKVFWKLYRQAGQYFDAHRLDGVILIDYPGFNWWIARAAKRRGIPVFYYGVPQMWAWAPWRIHKMRRLVDLALCKLPFEAEWFGRQGVRALDVGHPYYDEVAAQKIDPEFVAARKNLEAPWVVLLPGSRDQELTRNLDTLLESARRIRQEVPAARFAVACLHQRHATRAIDRAAELGLDGLEVHAGRTPEWIRLASCCIACSGSVSLELLYNECPTVIVYRIQRWAMWATRLMLRVRYVTLVNLLWTSKIERRDWSMINPDHPDAEAVPFPEYVTIDNPAERVARRVVGWLTRPDTLEQSRIQLSELKRKCVSLGASRRGAEAILLELEKRNAMDESASSEPRSVRTAA